MKDKAIINDFLVKVFNEILKHEQIALEGYSKNLSIREMHVIEAVFDGEKEGGNRANTLAKKLKITPGSLTTAISVLERKGYLKRIKDASDRRSVRVVLTEDGQKANRYHMDFHERMVESLTSVLDENETAVMVKALGKITEFFRAEEKED